MPEKKTIEKAKKDKSEGKAASTQAGVKLPAPKKGTVSETTRHKAQADTKAGAQGTKKSVSPIRSKAAGEALKKEEAASEVLSKQAKSAASLRTVAERSAAARRAARTKSAEERVAAAKKAAETRAETAPAKRTTVKRSSR